MDAQTTHNMHITPYKLHMVAAGGVWQLMADEKSDFMNQTLYTLTLITAVATPLMLLTGLFGMNFDDMDELVRARERPRAFEGSRGSEGIASLFAYIPQGEVGLVGVVGSEWINGE